MFQDGLDKGLFLGIGKARLEDILGDIVRKLVDNGVVTRKSCRSIIIIATATATTRFQLVTVDYSTSDGSALVLCEVR
jgi:hypothetical protein